MIFKKQINISENFGADYIEIIVEFLKKHFSVLSKGVEEIEMDLIYFNYTIDGYEISFISEGMKGTSILGKKSMVNKIVNKVKSDDPKLFGSLSN
jgi:hypothetical protein